MKKISSILLILVICLSFSSCEYNLSSIEGLMRPPKLSGESSLLQKAFEQSFADSNGIVMKTPLSGQYRSSYLFFDLENDGEQEAIVFYSNPIVDSFACASVFKKTNGEWKNISKIKGKNEEIYEVNFADINGDNVTEIIISWTGIADDNVNSSDFGTSNERIMSAYCCDGVTTTLLKTESYTKLYINDLNDDGCNEIAIFKINLLDNDKRTTVRFMGFESDYSLKFDETVTITGFLEIYNICTDFINVDNEKHTRIFIDGAISEIGVVTEIIDVDQKSFNISLPFYEQNKSQTPVTLRASRTFCCDIDNDGIIEIPTIEVLPYGMRVSEDKTKNSELNLTVWSEFNENKLSVDFKCLLNSSFGYMFIIPDYMINSLSAIYDDSNYTLTFFSINDDSLLNNELFSIKVFYEAEWDENNLKFSRIVKNDTFVYGYRIFSEDTEQYKDFINNNFCILNQELFL